MFQMFWFVWIVVSSLVMLMFELLTNYRLKHCHQHYSCRELNFFCWRDCQLHCSFCLLYLVLLNESLNLDSWIIIFHLLQSLEELLDLKFLVDNLFSLLGCPACTWILFLDQRPRANNLIDVSSHWCFFSLKKFERQIWACLISLSLLFYVKLQQSIDILHSWNLLKFHIYTLVICRNVSLMFEEKSVHDPHFLI